MAEPKFSNDQQVRVKTSGIGNPPSEKIRGKVVSLEFHGVTGSDSPGGVQINIYLATVNGERHLVREDWLEPYR